MGWCGWWDIEVVSFCKIYLLAFLVAEVVSSGFCAMYEVVLILK